MNLATLLLTLFALFAGAEPNTATGDTGSGLDPDG
jgi:hypothetical protein